MMPNAFASIDEYLAAVADPRQRAALEKLRRTIKSTVPHAEECFSYGMPAFRMGKPLVAFAAARRHCALYPMSGRIIAELADELSKFDTSKGTIRFQPERPPSAALLRRIIRARLAEIESATSKKSAKGKSVIKKIAKAKTATAKTAKNK
ncbi:MAG: DUF1801 domain-containing protein [Pirellulales bacterium]